MSDNENKIFRYRDLLDFISKVEEQRDEIDVKITDLNNLKNKIIESKSSGKIADSVIKYIDEVLIQILLRKETVLLDLQTKLTQSCTEIEQFDSNIKFKIDLEFPEKDIYFCEEVKKLIEEKHALISAEMNEVIHIVKFDDFSANNVIQHFDNNINHLINVSTIFENFDKNLESNLLIINEVFVKLQTLIEDAKKTSITANDYSSLFKNFDRNVNFQNMLMNYEYNINYLENEGEKLIGHHIRQIKGEKQLFVAFVNIGITVVVMGVVGWTMGPACVALFNLGGISNLFGAGAILAAAGTLKYGADKVIIESAELYQGYQEVRLGSAGDITTPSTNFVLEKCFDGNAEEYEKAKKEINAKFSSSLSNYIFLTTANPLVGNFKNLLFGGKKNLVKVGAKIGVKIGSEQACKHVIKNHIAPKLHLDTSELIQIKNENKASAGLRSKNIRARTNQLNARKRNKDNGYNIFDMHKQILIKYHKAPTDPETKDKILSIKETNDIGKMGTICLMENKGYSVLGDASYKNIDGKNKRGENIFFDNGKEIIALKIHASDKNKNYKDDEKTIIDSTNKTLKKNKSIKIDKDLKVNSTTLNFNDIVWGQEKNLEKDLKNAIIIK